MTEEKKIDFTEDLKTGDVNRVTDKAREMYGVGLEIKDLDKRLSDKKATYRRIETEELPTIMQEEIYADELPFDNGYKLVLKDVIAGSIPSESAIQKCKDQDQREKLIDQRIQAFQWLHENNASSLIANNLTIPIPKSKDGKEKVEKIKTLAKELALECFQEESVHHQTLNSYLKEQLQKEDAPDIPFDVFSIFVGKKAVIKEPKKK